LKGTPDFFLDGSAAARGGGKNKFTKCKYSLVEPGLFCYNYHQKQGIRPTRTPAVFGKEYIMSSQVAINTRRMLASNIYVGLQILVDDEFLTVTLAEKGEYCGQEVIEVDFDWPENCQAMHAGFYTPGEVVKVHSSSNQVLCI
ncbi:hypothetical protein, partial [Citrobacter freundii]|uniref:hypothetical protein n=1 Tax=Citrobacter freundii TaxID=546 RepID=UPI003977EEF2